MLKIVQFKLGPSASFDLGYELVTNVECPRCKTSEYVLRPAVEVPESSLTCPGCGEPRTANFTHIINGDDEFLDKTLHDLGIPPLDIIMGQNDEKVGYFELTGDVDTLFSFA